jgi:curli biogenesis system outer membrane secretion channel CsgG
MEDVQVLPRARQPLPQEKRKDIAVLSFEDKTDYGDGRLGTSAADILTTYLVQSGQFNLYERQKLDAVLAEQKLGADKKFDTATAVAVGRLVKVKRVVIGSVSSFGFRSRRSDVLIFGSKVVQEVEAVVDVRMIDVETGRIITSESGRGVVRVDTGQVLGVGTQAGYDETMAGNALRAAIARYVDNLIDRGAAD